MSQTPHTPTAPSTPEIQTYQLERPEDRLALAGHLEVAQDVPNGYGGFIIRAGEEITPKIHQALIQLYENGVLHTIRARSIGARYLNSAAQVQQQIINLVENVVRETSRSIGDLATRLKNSTEFQQFRTVLERNIRESYRCFNPLAIRRLKELQQHHPASGNHSVIAGFNEMMLCREESLPEAGVVQRALAVMQHDIGKIRIALGTLNWPGVLTTAQWEEMQLHTLLGFELLREDEEIGLPALTALLHHEWYARVAGKGYGGLTSYRDYLKTELGVEMDRVLANLDADAFDTIHQCAIVDMVAALEEVRSYKNRIGPFKVLVIMINDAIQGHFNPIHFARWYRAYRRDHPILLPKGLCVALPREIEKREYGDPVRVGLPFPRRMLTLEELEAVGLPPEALGWKERERIRRQGGLSVLETRRLIDQKKWSIDLDARIREQGIQVIKKSAMVEEQKIKLEVILSWVGYAELAKAELLDFIQLKNFSLELIRENNGILYENLISRGGESQVRHKLEQCGINWRRKLTIKLPAFEYRLSLENLERLELSPQLQQLRFEPKKYGIRVDFLPRLGIFMSDRHLQMIGLRPGMRIHYNPELLALLGIETEAMVFLDMLIVEEIDRVSKAKVAFLREGDSWQELKKSRPERLDLLQDYLVNKIGVVEMDFTATIAMPDLSHLRMGDHWRPGGETRG